MLNPEKTIAYNKIRKNEIFYENFFRIEIIVKA
jgi:hypothetical protein